MASSLLCSIACCAAFRRLRRSCGNGVDRYMPKIHVFGKPLSQLRIGNFHSDGKMLFFNDIRRIYRKCPGKLRSWSQVGENKRVSTVV